MFICLWFSFFVCCRVGFLGASCKPISGGSRGLVYCRGAAGMSEIVELLFELCGPAVLRPGLEECQGEDVAVAAPPAGPRAGAGAQLAA